MAMSANSKYTEFDDRDDAAQADSVARTGKPAGRSRTLSCRAVGPHEVRMSWRSSSGPSRRDFVGDSRAPPLGPPESSRLLRTLGRTRPKHAHALKTDCVTVGWEGTLGKLPNALCSPTGRQRPACADAALRRWLPGARRGLDSSGPRRAARGPGAATKPAHAWRPVPAYVEGERASRGSAPGIRTSSKSASGTC